MIFISFLLMLRESLTAKKEAGNTYLRCTLRTLPFAHESTFLQTTRLIVYHMQGISAETPALYFLSLKSDARLRT